MKFACIVLTHGRADRVFTHNTLRKSGYTGDIFLLCDSDDAQLDHYKTNFGEDKVWIFDKRDMIGKIDRMDNLDNMACVVYARNAVYEIARSKGLTHICVLDDDYQAIEQRIESDGSYRSSRIKNFDKVAAAYLDFLKSADLDCVCFAQGGDYIGGGQNTKVRNGFKTSRKMMNLYFFDLAKPIDFMRTINEDLTASIVAGRVGKKILTSYMNSIVQKETQSNAGGLTEIYLQLGTYTKSFYSVIACPDCVKVSSMGDTHTRIHHRVDWKYAVPKIIRQTTERKP